MAQYEHVDVLGVYAWGRRVGAVSAASRARGSYVFQYDPEWVASGIEIAPLLMRTGTGDGSRRDTFVFSTDQYNVQTFKGLPPVLADSLPDAFGNTLIDAALRERGIAGEPTALDRLAYMGSRTMGALTFEPAVSPPRDAYTAVDLRQLVETARAAVSGDLSTDESASRALRHLLQVGTSAGGARPKAVVAYHPHAHELRAGNIDLGEPGFEQWLLKFDGVGKRTAASTGQQMGDPQGYTRIEHAYYLMAADAGLDVPATRLVHEGGRAHFMIRRFDRDSDDARLHQQSLCGVAGLDFNLLPDASGVGNRYEDYFDTIAELGLDDDDTKREALRRMAFNVLAANNDDHTKNFAFLMNSAGTWSMAPAYDLTFAYRPDSEWVSAHLMSVNGKRDQIALQDIWEVADRYRVPGARKVVERVAAAVDNWSQYAAEAGVPGRHVDEVGRRLSEVRAHAKAPATARALPLPGSASADGRVCDAWMPRARRRCVLAVGHRGAHRSR